MKLKFLSNLKKTWPYIKDQKKYIIGFIFTNLTNIVISVIVPILSANIIVHLTNEAFTQLILIAIVIMGIELLRNVADYFSNSFSQTVYREGINTLSIELSKEILRLDEKTLKENGSGVFTHRLTTDIDRISSTFTDVTFYIGDIVMNIGIFVAIFIINKWAFVFAIIQFILLFMIHGKRVSEWMKNDKVYRKDRETVVGFTTELVRGASDIKMLNAEIPFINKLSSKIKNNNKIRYNMMKTQRTYRFFAGSLSDIFDMLLICLLVLLILKDNLAIASALVIRNYSNNLRNLTISINWFLDLSRDFNLSCDRIYAIIDGKDFDKEEFGTKHIRKVNGDFEFKNVTFAYDKNKVLNNMSFKVNANETVAFVGKSGAGKTTIFNLLCKMYNPNSGTITIDDIDINKLDKDSIRGNITIISQNPYIFNLSIKDNLKLVKKNLTDEEMKEACKLACLSDYIEGLPDKYDTVIGEGGVNLSGGQKQRLAIARALVQKTEIILFDEATSALDNQTQSDIQEAIRNLKGEYTILIIAHRLSTVIDADRIFVVDKGKIVDSGTHKELLKTSSFYQKLYEKDLNK